MPDIAMCPGGKCPHKETCYRYKAKPFHLQQYFAEIPINQDGTCDYYWKYIRLKKGLKDEDASPEDLHEDQQSIE